MSVLVYHDLLALELEDVTGAAHLLPRTPTTQATPAIKTTEHYQRQKCSHYHFVDLMR